MRDALDGPNHVCEGQQQVDGAAELSLLSTSRSLGAKRSSSASALASRAARPPGPAASDAELASASALH